MLVSHSVRDSRPDFAFVSVSGSDLTIGPAGSGYGPQFGPGNVAELSRRSGLSRELFNEAIRTSKYYRLSGGLLQRSVYVRSTATFEYLIVIARGNLRSVEFGGAMRQLSLRSCIVTQRKFVSFAFKFVFQMILMYVVIQL